MFNKSLETIASEYEGEMYDPNHLAGKSAKCYNWTASLNLPLNQFLTDDALNTSQKWKEWFKQEIIDAEQDGRKGFYQEILDKPIQEHIIAIDINGKLYPWDGFHRIGGSFLKERTNIPAIIGTPKNT